MPITGDLGASNYAKSQFVDNLLNQNPGKATEIANGNLLYSLEKQKKSINDALLSAQQGVDDTRTLLDEIKARAGSPWPQAEPNPTFSDKRGFLPTALLQPSLQTFTEPFNASAASGNADPKSLSVYSNDYKFKDWNGQILTDEPQFPKNKISTEDRFKASNKLPKTSSDLFDSPHSMRDVPLIFNDVGTDYFKFGLQTINNLTPIENPESGASTLRRDLFKGTPWEQNDPVYYGFDIIFDSVSSPLLNGSVNDFINNYAGINEIFAKKRVYEEFKNQFSKFFRTNASLKVDTSQLAITAAETNPGNLDSPSQLLNGQRSKAYFAYYIKSITGLDLLIEKNKGQAYSWAPKYKEDMIEIKMAEDVTLSLSTLAHLYKLLYWSRPNGKHLIPENLLRFNCQIIISEIRNLNRVRKDTESGNIEILKDNLSRWVYNLRECQFYFDKMPVPNEIDMSAEPKEFEGQSISFDFKYSTTKLERFVPDGKGWGKYVSYDAGAIWKIGNAGVRDARKTGAGGGESSVPTAFVDGVRNNTDNGVMTPYVIAVYGDKTKTVASVTTNSLDAFKSQSEKNSQASAEAASNEAIEKENSKKKPGQALASVISSSQFKKAKDFIVSVTGIKKYSPITQITSLMKGSNFYDKMGGLPWNNPLQGAIGGLINNTINKLYSNIPGPLDSLGDTSQVTIQQALAKELNKNRDTVMRNRINDDASKGKFTFAGEGPNSFTGKGLLATGYRPPVPFRAQINSLASVNAQSNIQYISEIGGGGYNLGGYKPPIKNSFSRNRGNQPLGNLYVMNQVTNFAGGPISDLIFTKPNAPGKRS
jgi:hypothetical protein